MREPIRHFHFAALLLVLLLVSAADAQSTAPPSEPATPSSAEPTAEPDQAAEEPPSEPPSGADATAAEPVPASQDSAGVEAEAGASSSSTTAGGDILVTGTRIKTSFGASAAPVDVIDRKALERSGARNLADVIQYSTATQGSGSQGAATAGPSGAAASALNLRGLGVGATLVLVNGRRLNPTGAAIGNAHFGDMSVIPIAAVERIEILKAGAAALYGADAVAGVVNVITRRNWEGVRLQVDGQTTSRFDQHEYTASASFGALGERSRVMAAMSYFRRSQLRAGERDYALDKYYIAPFFPATFYLLPGGKRMDDPICSATPGLCTGQYGQYIALFPNGERANVFSSAEYDLNAHLMLFAEFGVSRYRGDNSMVPSFDVLTPTIIVPANHVDNPFGQAAVFSGVPLGPSYGAGRQVAGDDSLRGVLGIKGDLAGLADSGVLPTWQWELSASMGISRYRESIADTLSDVFQTALNSCSDSSQLQNCFNPFYSALDGTGTPNSKAVIDRFSSRQVLVADHALQTYNAGANGTLFELPGGDAGLALGAEFRREWRTTEFDHDAQLLRFGFLSGNSDNTAERHVYSGYLELRLPFIDGIELQTAIRVERYSDTGVTSPSPFVGLTIAPGLIGGKDKAPAALRTLQLRGNVSTAFRAPTIVNTYPGYGTGPASLRYMGASAYVPVRYFGGSYVKPENALAVSAGLVWAPVSQFNVTLDYWWYLYKHRIQYENAQQLVLAHEMALAMGLPGNPGAVIVNQSMPTLLTGVDSKVINVRGNILTSGLDFGATLHFDGTDFGAEKTAAFISLGVQGTYTLNYDIPKNLIVGDIQDCEGTADTSPCHVVGKRNYYNTGAVPPLPQLRANLPLSFGYHDHSLTAIVHYISSFLDDFGRNPDGSISAIPAWISLDLQYGYTLNAVVGKRIGLSAGCKNVFDKMPPFVKGGATYFEIQVHDPRGRMFYASLDGEF